MHLDRVFIVQLERIPAFLDSSCASSSELANVANALEDCLNDVLRLLQEQNARLAAEHFRRKASKQWRRVPGDDAA